MNKELSYRRLVAHTIALALPTALIGLALSFFGPIAVFDDPAPLWTNLIWRDRLTRIGAAGLAGGALSVAGLALQGLFRNPLANPYVLGVSSGAGVGVLLGLLIPATWIPIWATTPTLAFSGALLTCVLVFAVAQQQGRLNPFALILSGVMFGAINGAVILVIYLFIDPYTLSNFIGWSMGRVPDAVEPALLFTAGLGIVTGTALLFRKGAALNVLDLGEMVAQSSGVAVGRLRTEVFATAALCTGFAVALVGPVGFLGLFVPHILRLIHGPDHRVLVLWCFFCGGAFLMLADALCRWSGYLLSMGTIPVGVLTTLLGGPFFIWLLRRKEGFRVG